MLRQKREGGEGDCAWLPRLLHGLNLTRAGRPLTLPLLLPLPGPTDRMKFAAATERRKGQVQEVRAGGAGAYGGEATGIKSRLSKSVRL